MKLDQDTWCKRTKNKRFQQNSDYTSRGNSSRSSPKNTISSYTYRKKLKKMLTTTLMFLIVATIATCYGLTQNAAGHVVPIAATTTATVHNTKGVSPPEQQRPGEIGADYPGLRRARRSPAKVAAANGRQQGNNNQAEDSVEASQQQQQQHGSAGIRMAAGSGPAPASGTIKNVTAQNGQSVLLHCLVEPSSEATSVSWFRGTGDLQLLTFENSTIVPDERFIVRHGLVKQNDWALQIKNVDKNTDAGLYQCQTNTEQPQSQYYQLNIVEPQVHILGAPDMAVKLGANINLTCVISQSPDQLQFVFWYRDDRMINYDMNERGKVSVSKWPHQADTVRSSLQIFNSKLTDSGNYTCLPSGARPVSIYVHVLEGPDKRLIMFQNDYDPSAASSQQTNSAISVHVIRLTRGRSYALLMAFYIFYSWFSIVVQLQTAISLLLLAIIGFFLGKVTDQPSRGKEQRRRLHQNAYWTLEEARKKSESERDANEGGDDKSAKDKDKKRKTDSYRSIRSPKLAQLGDDEDSNNRYGQHDHYTANSSETSDEQRSESAAIIEPLIKRANSALNLLKALADSAAATPSGSEDDERSDNSSGAINSPRSMATQPESAPVEQQSPLDQSVGISAPTTPAKGTKQQQQQQQQQQSNLEPACSPSASSSSASTGYNSDTHSSSAQQVIRVPAGRKMDDGGVEGGEEEEESSGQCCNGGARNEEMIELVSQPTALTLLMDELTASSSGSARRLTTLASPISSAGVGLHQEPYYSAPAKNCLVGGAKAHLQLQAPALAENKSNIPRPLIGAHQRCGRQDEAAT